ncbi:hypothetical protein K1F50_16010 [Muricauda oceani]|uniref:Uncharacterized protein n=1 Tax=Flagellimonas oceani TaxID=2698672 RepID=A0A6G7IYK2_9FLAO|nr:hypothetical protein [Allomuricauda oceani]MBW8244315.1 hypothetical protein [Allomuricauda oceani]QII43272.1 hypothetical protein GVT53_00715 [Allomuricauda oceani]
MNKIDSTLLWEILEDIRPENKEADVIGQITFEKVDVLVKNHFERDFCQLLLDSIEVSTDLRKIAIILDILTWSTPDNGTKLDRLTSDWLESGDLTKIKCILFRHEWLPENEEWKKKSESIIKADESLIDLVQYYNEEVEYFKNTGIRRIEKLRRLINSYLSLSNV